MANQEYQFCETKGKLMTFFNPAVIVGILKTRRRLTIENIFNAFFVAKECVRSKSDGWVVYANFQKKPISVTIPLTRRKPSEQMLKLMAEGYEDSVNDDLALAKEFEELEPEVDDEHNQ